MAIKDIKVIRAASEGAVTTSQGSNPFPDITAAFTKGTFYLEITAVSGTTPSMIVKLQHQNPMSSNWSDVSGGAFTAATATGEVAPITVDLPSIYYRFFYTLTGTSPSFTFNLCAVGMTEEQVP